MNRFFSLFGGNKKPQASSSIISQLSSLDGMSVAPGPYQYTAVQDYEITQLIAYSRKFYRENILYKTLIDRLVNLIIADDGFQLRVVTSNTELNVKMQNLFSRFWLNPEITGRYTGHLFERLVVREYLIAGEVYLLKVAGKKFQVIPAEYIDKVEINDNGTLKNVVIKMGKETKTFGPDAGIYLSNSDNLLNPRGCPMLASSFPILLRLNIVVESETFAWQLVSRIPLVVKRKNARALALQESNPDPNAAAQEMSFAERIQDSDFGLIFHCEPDEEVATVDRGIPQVNFREAFTTFLRVVTALCGIPVELVLNDMEKLNYSQSKAMLEFGRSTIRFIQTQLTNQFYSKLPEYLVTAWKKEGLIPKDYFKDELSMETVFQWIAPQPFKYFSEEKELKKYQTSLDMSLITLDSVAKEMQNEGYEKIQDQRQSEINRAIEIANKIYADTGVRVPWEYFSGNTVTAVGKTESTAEGIKREFPNRNGD